MSTIEIGITMQNNDDKDSVSVRVSDAMCRKADLKWRDWYNAAREKSGGCGGRWSLRCAAKEVGVGIGQTSTPSPSQR